MGENNESADRYALAVTPRNLVVVIGSALTVGFVAGVAFIETFSADRLGSSQSALFLSRLEALEERVKNNGAGLDSMRASASSSFSTLRVDIGRLQEHDENQERAIDRLRSDVRDLERNAR